MAILYKKKQDGGKLKKKKKLIGDKGKDYKGSTRLRSGSFAEPYSVSAKEEKQAAKEAKKKKKLADKAAK